MQFEIIIYTDTTNTYRLRMVSDFTTLWFPDNFANYFCMPLEEFEELARQYDVITVKNSVYSHSLNNMKRFIDKLESLEIMKQLTQEYTTAI